MNNFLPIRPGKRVNRSNIPCLPLDDFRDALLDFADNDGYVVQFFAYEERDAVSLISVVRRDNELFAGCCPAQEKYPSLTKENTKFHLFEREIAEQFAVLPEGHPWMKNVRFHPNWRGKPDAFDNTYEDIPGNYPYFQVEGDEIHEVAVGPVHAGIIEPGHFRFQCIGEKVLHLEIQHGYQHRGIERLMTTIDRHRRPVIAESIAGDTAIANSICYCQAVEALKGIKVPDEAAKIRTVAMELERLANHTGDLGALAGDVAFSTAAAYFGRMRGDFLNLLLHLSGNRFGKGLIRPGGVVSQWDESITTTILDKIEELGPQLEEVSDLLFSAHTVLGRFEGCGVVSREKASEIGLVGFAGRASGLDYDVRFTMGPDDNYHEKEKTIRSSGDVFARAWIRYEEIVHSLACIKKILGTKPISPECITTSDEGNLTPDSLVVTMTEAWRGELSHCLLTDENGGLLRYKIKDPSFHNWTGLALALRNEGISDFPLNNKSFNLSYCGFDL
jgi:Ni,Fe-hydrogenase III large subunit